jgi:hypothetical protein
MLAMQLIQLLLLSLDKVSTLFKLARCAGVAASKLQNNKGVLQYHLIFLHTNKIDHNNENGFRRDDAGERGQ